MTFYIETYGCQMNTNDSATVQQILQLAGFMPADSIATADIILVNTCSVRARAEQKVLQRLHNIFHTLRKAGRTVPPVVIGVLGCMAARLKEELFSLNSSVKLVVGPDEYQRLPELIRQVADGESVLATNEDPAQHYESFIGHHSGGISSYITIMRGCDNFCAYCIVPLVRGRERSRPALSIMDEIATRQAQGVKEICLLGQNVNSYSRPQNSHHYGFADLLGNIAEQFPQMWIRFLTSHPRDMSSPIIQTIARYDNICNAIHLPVQSGSDNILKQMNRHYTAEHYMELVAEIRATIPDVSLSTDIIAGYPGETLADHKASIELLTNVRYDNAYMFRYSRRAGTAASLQADDVPEAEKIRRLNEIIDLQNTISAEANLQLLGHTLTGMVEKPSRRQAGDWLAKSQTGKQIVFDNSHAKYPAGAIVPLQIVNATSATLAGTVVLIKS